MTQYVVKSTLLGLSIALTACGGGGSGGSGESDTPPAFSVTSVTPGDGEINVEPEAALKAGFNRNLLASSIDNVELTKNSGAGLSSTPASVSLDTSKSINVQPGAPLNILSEYTVTVSQGVTDTSGNPLDMAFSWRFITRDGDWEGAGLIDQGSAVAKDPEIAVDLDGNGWAVWLKEDLTTGNDNVIGRYYNAAEGNWESQTLPLNSDNSSDASNVRIAVSLDGRAIVAWVQDAAVFARHWDAGSAANESSWSAVEKISGADPVYSGNSLRVEFSSSNRAKAVWIEQDAAVVAVASNEFWTAGSGWLGAQTGPELNPSISARDYDIDFATAIGGDGVFLWVDTESTLPGAESRVYAIRYVGDSRAWASNVIALEPSSVTGEARDPSVVFDKEGNAFAVWWRRSDDIFGHIYASRYDADSGGWSDPTRIMGSKGLSADEDNLGRFPSIAVDLKGNVMISFSNGAPHAAYYNANDGQWGEAQTLGDFAGTAKGNVAMDVDGNATVVWRKNEGTADNVFSNRYSAVTDSWGPEKRVERGGGGKASVPSIAAYWNRSAITVWEDDGRIYANRFAPE